MLEKLDTVYTTFGIDIVPRQPKLNEENSCAEPFNQ